MWLRRFTRVFAVVGLFVVLITVIPQPLEWWIHALTGPWNDPKGDTLIVLGGDVLEDGTLGLSSYWRCIYAARVWREGGFKKVLVSGKGATPFPVAIAMRQFIACQGVPENAVQAEPRSNSTRENALAAIELLRADSGRKVLLTSDYHMFRAYRTFRKAGLDVQPRPFPDGGKRIHEWSDRWRVFCDLSLETSKVAYYWARGWI